MKMSLSQGWTLFLCRNNPSAAAVTALSHVPGQYRAGGPLGRCLLTLGNRAPLIGYMPLPPGYVPPCLPTKASTPPSGEEWLHEIKHDGFRVIARKDGD